LALRGVPSVLFERRARDERSVARANMTNVRSMEHFRRWGIADQVKGWGFPRDFPFDNVFVTALVGHEIGRIPMPSIGMQQYRQRERAGAGNENTFEQMIGKKTQPQRRQCGEYKRQSGAMQRADQRRGRADAIGDMRQLGIVRDGSVHD